MLEVLRCSCSGKYKKLVGGTDIDIGLSTARGWNPFPWLYRGDSIRQSNTKVFSHYSNNSKWPPFPSGDDILREHLAKAVAENEPIILLSTAPLTTLSDLLKKEPGLEKGIAKMIWMGGAIDVPGNLDSKTIPSEVANPKAEWNVFWDPYAVDWIFKNTSFHIVLFSLDVTDKAPFTKDFLTKLKSQSNKYIYSEVASQGYGLVSDDPYYDMWNSLTTSYIAHPEFFKKGDVMKLNVETEGFYQGAISRASNGRSVEVVIDVTDKAAFYNYVLDELKR